MSAVLTTLLDRLLVDRPPVGAEADAAARRHREHRASWYAACVGPLAVPDTALAATGRAAAGSAPLDVAVVNTSGAGGLTALAGRATPGLRVVAVESTLRDLDDLAGNAARVVAAALALDDDVAVTVGLPDAPGWVRAVEVVEAAGLRAGVSCDADAWRTAAAAGRLAERLSVLVEADLPFSLDPGPLPAPGRALASLAMVVEALVDGAEPDEAAELLLVEDAARLRSGLGRWDEATAHRVRRRLLAVGTDPGGAVDELVALGLLTPPAPEH